MINFTEIKYKNFLSTGNAYTTIDLKSTTTTLIVGQNGSGKSTMLDATCFALFGKPYRNINKPQLVNSINGKNCVVEIQFSIGKNKYRIIRGIKPTIFEIWINEELLDQDAASRDYQKYLEDVILKLNFKSFTQIVIVGSASFTPFMELPAASRREIIEDLLDIKIFSAMNTVLKSKLGELQSDVIRLDGERDKIRTKAQMQERMIKTLQATKETRLDTLLERKETILRNRDALVDEQAQKKHLLDRQEAIVAGMNTSELQAMHRQRDLTIHKYKENIKSLERLNEFYKKTPTCPKCLQVIDETLRDTTERETVETVASLTKQIDEEQAIYDAETMRIREIQKLESGIRDIEKDLYAISNKIETNEKQYIEVERDITEANKEDVNIDEEKQRLKEIAKEGIEIEKKRSKLAETRRHYDIAGTMLKDSGIKTRIVKKYLPVINKIVNKYLAAMDFFVQFNLDEKFNEVIKSRHRDDFTYASFSEGEKQRISLALLFTWRDVARLKNTANTNLLILDEVFDSSLDQRATEQVLELLSSLGDKTNLFVISHKSDQLISKFDRTIKFEKKNNFSVIV
jgi:DNA repair exonuclease SbcCD ATPase subunit